MGRLPFFSVVFEIWLVLASHISELTAAYPDSITDQSSLLAFKANIDSDPHNVLANWHTNTSFCNWTGVSCSRRRERITALSLPSSSLSGTIAPQIGNLSFLLTLNLANNTFHGHLLNDFVRLRRLRILILSRNELTGAIPPSLFNMSSLQHIALARNFLTGDVSAISGLWLLPRLQGLYLSRNQFTGEILSKVYHCLELEEISLSYNRFTGNIPNELSNLHKLKVLYLGSNNITGKIPASMYSLTELEIFDIADNHISGDVSAGVGKLHNLHWLNLGRNNLKGVIPGTILNISSLQILDLSFNRLFGQFPAAIDVRLANLQEIYLGDNQFSGEIPVSLSNVSMLTVLDLAINSFSGSVPMMLGNLRLLQILNFENNQLNGGLGFLTSLTGCKLLENLVIGPNEFNGFLPDSVGNLSTHLLRFLAPDCNIKGKVTDGLGNLSSLIYLDLSKNELEGTIPSSIGRLEKLQRLILFGNNLQGFIPSELYRLRHLGELLLYENMLSGSISNSIRNISRLQRLSLASNKLTSTIPMGMWSLTNLWFLNLSYNSLRGSLATEVENLEGMKTLDLSANRFSGNIPNTLGDLQMLSYLSLSHNSFGGSVPQSFGNLMSLTFIDLSTNALSGMIPKSLEALRYLNYLNFSFNRLEGEIPVGGVFVNFTAQSFTGNAALCGAPQLQVPPCTTNVVSKSTVKTVLLKYVLPVIASILGLAVGLSLLIICRRKKIQVPIPFDQSPLNHRRMISYQEIVRATDCFCESNLLGVGSSGSVYKGKLIDGLLVAIKVLNLQTERAEKNFKAECQVMSMARHKNLVKIISTCSNFDFKALVLEFMPNGSLEKWLYSHNYHLSLLQRLNIMIDVALALEYLHHEYSSAVVHCDLKPSNVLLDEDMSAHVSDFGIAKLLAGNNKSITRTGTLGTFGYIAPEYGWTGRVSTLGDVYSYGILLLETFTRKKPIDGMFVGATSLRQWVNNAYPDAVMEVVDENLLKIQDNTIIGINGDLGTMRRWLSAIMELGLLCSMELPKERTIMKEVVVKLRKIKMELNGSGVVEVE